MRRLIIVSPHFPPANAADHQRVRMALPYLSHLGWDPVIVAVDPLQSFAPVDPFLHLTVPPEIPVRRVNGLPRSFAFVPGLGALAHRNWWALRRAMRQELAAAPPGTIVYFSTTQFPVHSMIPGLRREFGARFVMDYQDRWVNDYYSRHPRKTPPGGRLKYTFAVRLARRQERSTLRSVDGFTAVSAQYRVELVSRYPALASTPFLVLPFGAPELDFAALSQSNVAQRQFSPTDGRKHWVYVGRGGMDLHFALRGFFRALRRRLATDHALRNVRLHFIGTDYASPARARPTIAPLALEYGLADVAVEVPVRTGYGEALRCLCEADALIVPGSDDPAYTASKIYPYVLARKPTLTIFHRQSSVNQLVRNTHCAVSVDFESSTTEAALADAIDRAWFETAAYERPPNTDWNAFEPYSARSMTERLSRFLASIQDHP